MAVDGILQSLPGAVAAASMATHLYRFVALDATPGVYPAGTGPIKVKKATAATGVIGVAYDNPSEVGAAVQVVVGGVVKVVSAATLAPGAEVTSDANGAAVAATASNFSFGVVVVGGDAADIIEVLVRPRTLAA